MRYNWVQLDRKKEEKAMKTRQEGILAQVDHYLSHGWESTISEGLLVEDKLLLYENRLNPNNRFSDRMVFKKLPALKWINFLCNTDKLADLFLEQFYIEEEWTMSALRLCDYVRNVLGRGQSIQADQLEEAIADKDYARLHFLLQEVFLEPIEYVDLLYLNLWQKQGISMEQFLKQYRNSGGKRYLRFVGNVRP